MVCVFPGSCPYFFFTHLSIFSHHLQLTYTVPVICEKVPPPPHNLIPLLSIILFVSKYYFTIPLPHGSKHIFPPVSSQAIYGVLSRFRRPVNPKGPLPPLPHGPIIWEIFGSVLLRVFNPAPDSWGLLTNVLVVERCSVSSEGPQCFFFFFSNILPRSTTVFHLSHFLFSLQLLVLLSLPFCF